MSDQREDSIAVVWQVLTPSGGYASQPRSPGADIESSKVTVKKKIEIFNATEQVFLHYIHSLNITVYIKNCLDNANSLAVLKQLSCKVRLIQDRSVL